MRQVQLAYLINSQGKYQTKTQTFLILFFNGTSNPKVQAKANLPFEWFRKFGRWESMRKVCKRFWTYPQTFKQINSINLSLYSLLSFQIASQVLARPMATIHLLLPLIKSVFSTEKILFTWIIVKSTYQWRQSKGERQKTARIIFASFAEGIQKAAKWKCCCWQQKNWREKTPNGWMRKL